VDEDAWDDDEDSETGDEEPTIPYELFGEIPYEFIYDLYQFL